MSEAPGAQAGLDSDAVVAVATAVVAGTFDAAEKHSDAADPKEASKASESSSSSDSDTSSDTDSSESPDGTKSSEPSKKGAAETTPMYLELDLDDFALDPATYEEVESPIWLDPPHIGTPSLDQSPQQQVLGIDSTDAEKPAPVPRSMPFAWQGYSHWQPFGLFLRMR